MHLVLQLCDIGYLKKILFLHIMLKLAQHLQSKNRNHNMSVLFKSLQNSTI